MARGNLKEQIENRSKEQEKEPDSKINPKDFVSTGSTLLNLALTDSPFCGWQKGKMSNIIGDSSAGKTFVTLTAYAEASNNPEFDKFRFIFDDAENANEFDIEHLFGEDVADRLVAPRVDKNTGEELPSETMEDFHDNLLSAIETKIPFIYTLDSFDSLTTTADDDKMEEQRSDRAKGKEVKGSYGMTKAKKSSEILRHVCGKLKRTDSLLLIISQTRDNLVVGSFEKKTRSGGKALKFYCTFELWLALGGTIKYKDRIIGVNCIVTVKKNKVTGKRRTVEFPIYYDIGIDNVGSCIDFLVEEKFWTKEGLKINTKGDLGLGTETKAKLIQAIEKGNLEKKLDVLVGKCWNEIENSLKSDRKKRY